MPDARQYTAQAEHYTRLAALASTEDEREGHLRIAGAYMRLATDAAIFAKGYGDLLLHRPEDI